jgi:hypothetical protein
MTTRPCCGVLESIVRALEDEPHLRVRPVSNFQVGHVFRLGSLGINSEAKRVPTKATNLEADPANRESWPVVKDAGQSAVNRGNPWNQTALPDRNPSRGSRYPFTQESQDEKSD